MSFRSLDLGKYHLDQIQYTAPISESVAREAISVAQEPDEEIHWRGWHPYTIQGNSYWADLHIYKSGTAEAEEREVAFTCRMTLHAGDPEHPFGEKVIRRIATEMIETVGSKGTQEYVIATGQFFFPSEEFESPVVPAAAPAEWEEETPELPEEYWLRPIGVRFGSEKGHFDVIIDTAPGPIMVRIEQAIGEPLSLQMMRNTMRNFHEFAELLVDEKPEEDGED